MIPRAASFELRQTLDAPYSDAGMSSEVPQQLAALRPVHAEAVIDLLEQAGIDVARWQIDRNGNPVANYRSNPAYCYEWAFGGKGEPIVLCIWHEELESKDGRVLFEGNLRLLGTTLKDRGRNKSYSKKDRDKARRQAPRCETFDFAVQEAWFKSLPIRTIILEGNRQNAEDEGVEASTVGRRRLDDSSWRVESYSDGQFVLVRGEMQEGELQTSPALKAQNEPSAPDFVDQFSIPEASPVRVIETTTIVRSPAVREAVLTRSTGRCELCGLEGFVTASGSRYLETHHVVPLSEDGPDVEWNVLALCPTDHRIAHYGADRHAFRERLAWVLDRHYPGAAERLRTLYSLSAGDEA